LTEQILTVDKSHLIDKVGECTEDVLRGIAKALIIQIDLTDYLQSEYLTAVI